MVKFLRLNALYRDGIRNSCSATKYKQQISRYAVICLSNPRWFFVKIVKDIVWPVMKLNLTRSYKENFSIDLRYAKISAFALANKSHVTIFSQSEAQNSSVA